MIVLLYGPSGVGKSTIEEMLIKEQNFKRLVAYTTRPPRKNEINGVHYNFISYSEYQKIKNEFIAASTFKNIQGLDFTYGIKLNKSDKNKNLVYSVISYSYLSKIINGLENEKIPYKVIYLHVNEDERKRRYLARGSSLEEFEQRKKYEDNYLKVIKEDGRIYLINAEYPPNEVMDKILKAINQKD